MSYYKQVLQKSEKAKEEAPVNKEILLIFIFTPARGTRNTTINYRFSAWKNTQPFEV